ncbi:LytTR family DNA-binding domain-containing protein [Fodinibius sediminis]|uniref:Transcriptional regulator, LytTR family n=1 Tax=Fodinibius sediminis TaxID=1214077 RepID=A0A521DJX6_9BACT|nr:LytTR family DNA-binding domain-containing protein [Fodinibius sediminis]SMO72033.1 transcriptional regulator, LytTR family [Fodinibius sediminis]
MRLRLNYPYPFYYNTIARIVKIAAALAVIIPLFMLLFTPFNINYEEHRFAYPLIVLLFGIVDSLVFLGVMTLSLKFFPTFANEDQWTLLRELSIWAIILLLIGISNFLLRQFMYINPFNLSFGYLLEEIIHSYLFGLLAVSLLTLFNFAYQVISKTQKTADWNMMVQQINDSLEPPRAVPVTLRAPSENEEISFNLANFIFARVDGNYVEIYLREENGETTKHIKRNTLKNVEKQLQPYDNIQRIHRSYLVNCDYITGVEGNAQGYQLTIDGYDGLLSVSRSYISKFDAVMNNK